MIAKTISPFSSCLDVNRRFRFESRRAGLWRSLPHDSERNLRCRSNWCIGWQRQQSRQSFESIDGESLRPSGPFCLSELGTRKLFILAGRGGPA